ncbi:MAG: hypothetical protein AB8B91_11425 [Rubripirellula sp.]
MNRTPPASLISSAIYAITAFALISNPATCSADKPTQPAEKPAAATEKAAAKEEAKKDWKALNGKWKVSQFGGDGPVEIKEDLIKMELGDPLTGVRWEGDVLRENYELTLETQRTDGFDFFCGLTFPVGEDNVTFILGGWGGGVVGISNVDGHDASENDTTFFRNFDNDTWYKVRVRVDPHFIRCWIDEKNAVEQERKGHKFDIRYEMDQSVPLGVAAFQCDSEIRNVRLRKLTKKELAAAKEKAEQE